MKYLLGFVILISFYVYGEEGTELNRTESAASGLHKSDRILFEDQIKNIAQIYLTENYQYVLTLIENLEEDYSATLKAEPEKYVQVEYWKGLCYARINEFDLASKHFGNAILHGNRNKDIYYEYGQAQYALENMNQARKAFAESVRSRYKSGVSLYYMGFISQQLKEYKKAVKYYQAIEKLRDDEKKDVVQAARMQTGDIYYQLSMNKKDINKIIDTIVIPQYQKALAWNEESPLSADIRKKIESLQRQFELLLFKMRNGRPTARPPYFAKINFTYGYDSNPLTLSEDSKSSYEQTAAPYMGTSLYYRYAFYPNDMVSIAPLITANYNKYNSSETSITALDSYGYSAGVQVSLEHIYNSRPATFFIDAASGKTYDDEDADQAIEELGAVTSFGLNEIFEFFPGQQTTFRLKYYGQTGVDASNTFAVSSFVAEQLLLSGTKTFYFYYSYAQTRYDENTSENTDAHTLRVDLILPTFKQLFNPGFFVSDVLTSYTESTYEDKNLMNIGYYMNRLIAKNWYAYFNLSYSTQTSDTDSLNYSGMNTSLSVEYYF